MLSQRLSIALVALLVTGAWVHQALGCPFCSAVSQTFSEEIAAMDVVVITRFVESPHAGNLNADAQESPAPNDDATHPVKSKFEITQVIKGQQWLNDSQTIETLYFGNAKIGELFLIMGADPPDVMWSTPLLLSERAREYILNLVELPRGPERLVFFLQHLEDKDEMLTRDAYDEFAKAPYRDLIGLRDKMDHDRLVGWIKDADVPVSRRRLYLTMLGVCGSVDDTPMLEEMLRSEDQESKAGLDALIACYLILKGPAGMALVEDLYLKNQEAAYADTYSAIMALRFHGSEGTVIPRERLLEGLRYMLDRPQLADLVIPDLARWEDWSVMDRLAELFQEADDESSWVRVPVINYLRACPLPEAKERIAALEKIDPEAVKRANTFFPFAAASGSKRQGAQGAGETGTTAGTSTEAASQGGTELTVTDAAVTSSKAGDPEVADATGSESAETAAPGRPGDDAPSHIAATANPGEANAADPQPTTSAAATSRGINVVLLLGAPLVVGGVLLGVLWLVLRGTGNHVKS